jgi:hypothetical protein
MVNLESIKLVSDAVTALSPANVDPSVWKPTIFIFNSIKTRMYHYTKRRGWQN